MTNLKKILTTLPAVVNNQRLRLTAFRRSFKIIQQLLRCGYSRGCMFTLARLVLSTMVLICYALWCEWLRKRGNQISEELRKNYSEVELKSRISLSHLSVKLLEMKHGKKCLSGFLFRCCINTFCTSIILSCCGILSLDLRLVSSM